MNYIWEFRKKSGMTQQTLADLVGVSQATIALAERNKRSLPTHALIKFDAVEKEFKTMNLKILPTLNQFVPDAKTKKQMLKKLKLFRFRLYSAQYKFKGAMEKYQVLAISHKHLDHSHKKSKKDSVHEANLKLNARKSGIQLRRYSEKVIPKLIINIGFFQYMVSFYESYFAFLQEPQGAPGAEWVRNMYPPQESGRTVPVKNRQRRVS